jgi:hypothetical protein
MKNVVIFVVFASLSFVAYQAYAWDYLPANSAMRMQRPVPTAENFVISRNNSANPYYRANPYYKPDPVGRPKMIYNPYVDGKKANPPKSIFEILVDWSE